MKLRRSFLALGLSSVMVCLPLAGGNAAMISPVAGTTDVNGKAIPRGAVLLPGELVTVGAKGTARVLLPGSSITAASNTTFRLEENGSTSSLRLGYGMLDVTGIEGVAVTTHTVVPRSGAQFEIMALKTVNYLAVKSGSVSLNAFGRSETVRAGEAVSFDNGQQASPAPTGGGGTGLSVPLAVGIAVGAAAITGVVVHEATECSMCKVVTPSQP